ncbi:MAG: RAMP superfamily CRISPR-associated protein [Candidatus Helarchaeota archaeon]
MNDDKIILKIWFGGPVHFGMGKESITGSDLGIFYINNQIYIPGSSIKGVLRNAVLKFCKALYREYNCDKLKSVLTCDPWAFEGLDSHFEDSSNCPVCNIFGWQDKEAKILFNDLIIDADDPYIIENRSSIRIDRILNSTEKKMLMQFEFLNLRDTKYNPAEFEIKILSPLDDIEYTLLYYGTKLITKFGGQGSKGMGKVEKIELEIPKKINYEDVLKSFLEDNDG